MVTLKKEQKLTFLRNFVTDEVQKRNECIF